MDRRTLVKTFVFGLLTAPLAVEAQPAEKIWRIGYLSPGSISSHGRLFEAFRLAFAGLGYAEGRNFVVEYRWAEGRQDRLVGFAAELVQAKVDVLMTSGTPASLAARRASRTIPIVLLGVADPVASGLVASLPRPGGNVTGFSLVITELVGKRLELIKGLVPALARVALVWNPSNQGADLAAREAEAAAPSLGLQLQAQPVRGPDDFDRVFREAVEQRAQALLVLEDPLTVVHRNRIKNSPPSSDYRRSTGSGSLPKPVASCPMRQITLTCIVVRPSWWTRS